jgi:hypothetical protein
MQRILIALAIVVGLAATSVATAQEKKKSNSEQKNTQSNSQKSAPFGGQSCSGLLWVGSSCYMPDGRICQVMEGTSGRANLACSNR